MNKIDQLAKALKDSAEIKEKKKTSPYDTNAKVVRVDGNTAWVAIDGGVPQTPATMVVNAKEGDKVRVRVGGGKAYVTGNATAPPTDDRYVLLVTKEAVDYIAELKDKDVTVRTLTAAAGYFDELHAKSITTDDLKATTGYIKDLTSENITAKDITADHATIDTLDSTYATIDELHSDYAEIDLANVNNAWINNGVIKKAEVFDENVFDLSGNRATLSRIDASKINVANLRADNLVVRRINGQPVVGGYTLIDSNSPQYESKNPQELGWYEFVNAQWVLSTDTTVDMTKAYYQEGDEVSLYDQTYIDGLKNDLQQQIDGAVETFTGSVVPTLVNYPYTDWYDTSVTPVHDERAKHVGDIYYVVNSSADEGGYCYRFAFDETNHEYMWVLIKDTDITKALSDISDLQTFESETTSWIDETDQGLETIRTNHTALSGRVDTVETTANNALPAATFASFESTTFTDLVDEVDEQSTTMTNMTTRLGLNADGTQSATDIVTKESALEQTVNGISSRVGKTEMHLAGMYATSSTAAGTAAKVATIVPALSNYELANGAMVTVKFTAANTTASPTLNLNGTGAKAIKTYSGGNLAEAEYKWKAGSTFTFTYNGTNWLMQDSTASVRMNTAETEITQTADKISLVVESGTSASNLELTDAAINAVADNMVIKSSTDNSKTVIQGGKLYADQIEIGSLAGEIGGRNLIRNTNSYQGWYVSGSQYITYSGDTVTISASGLTALSYARLEGEIVTKTANVRNGDYYTLSFEIMSPDWSAVSEPTTSNTGFAAVMMQFVTSNSPTGSQLAYFTRRLSVTAFWKESPTPTNNKWLKFVSVPFQYNNDSQWSSVSSGFGTYIRVGPQLRANGTIKVRNIKFEKGSKATDWTPAPEDGSAVNLIPWPYYRAVLAGDTYTSNGITWTLNKDGSITATGTATADSWYVLAHENYPQYVNGEYCLPPNTYTLSGCPSAGSSTTCRLNITVYTTPNTSSGANTYTEYGDGITFTPTSAQKYARIQMCVKSGCTCPSGGYTFYPMLEVGGMRHSFVSPRVNEGAASVATSYITRIDANGIRIHPSSTENNSILLNASGMEVFKGGTAAANSVAFYGDSARVGPSGKGRVDIAPSGIDMYGYNANASPTTQNLCHIGFDSGNAQSGQAIAPYFTFGTRASGSSIGNYSVAEGYNTTASHWASHAEGSGTTASSNYTHAEGSNTTASAMYAHAEGFETTASDVYAHAEGYGTKATNDAAHAEGYETQANGYGSHAQNVGTVASGTAQTVIGKYNATDTTSLFIVGNGSATTRSNAFKIDSTGDIYPRNTKMVDFVVEVGTSGTWQYKKYADGTLVCWGYSTIDVTTGTKDRKELSFPVAFVGTPSVQLTVVENAYNIQPILLVWESSGKVYALNKASVPSKHINFNCLAIGKWK